MGDGAMDDDDDQPHIIVNEDYTHETPIQAVVEQVDTSSK